mmetsp:Transcript_19799/g.34093  ORF Transcript_19799/g.34093 Transcript_19799/m.34093 type:complete len:250 (-) Transcript_19799:94-843(-)
MDTGFAVGSAGTLFHKRSKPPYPLKHRMLSLSSSPEGIAKATPRSFMICIIKIRRDEHPKEPRNGQPHRIPQFFSNCNESHFFRSDDHGLPLLGQKERHVNYIVWVGVADGRCLFQAAPRLLHNFLCLLIERLRVDGCHFVGCIFVNAKVGQGSFAHDKVSDIHSGFQCRRLKPTDGSAKVVSWIIFFILIAPLVGKEGTTIRDNRFSLWAMMRKRFFFPKRGETIQRPGFECIHASILSANANSQQPI